MKEIYETLDNSVKDIDGRMTIVEGTLHSTNLEEEFFGWNNGMEQPLTGNQDLYTESYTASKLETLADYLLELDDTDNVINSYKKDEDVQQPALIRNEENMYIEKELSDIDIVDFRPDAIYNRKKKYYAQDELANPYLLSGQSSTNTVKGETCLRTSDLFIPEFKALWDIREEIRLKPSYRGQRKDLGAILAQLYAIKDSNECHYQGKHVVKQITEPDLYYIDFTNKEHIKPLLSICSKDNNSEWLVESLLMKDKLLNDTTLNETQTTILKLLENGFFHDKYEVISEELANKYDIYISRQAVDKAINTIAEKVVNQYILTHKTDENTDFAYLNNNEKIVKELQDLA